MQHQQSHWLVSNQHWLVSNQQWATGTLALFVASVHHVLLTNAPLRLEVLQASCWLAGLGYHFWFDYSFLSTPFVHMLRLDFQLLGHLRHKPSLASQPLGDRIPVVTTWVDSKWLRMKEKNVDMTWTETWTWLSNNCNASINVNFNMY